MSHSLRFPLAVVGLSLLFGLICVLPNIWQRFDAKYPFKGIEILGSDQEHYYAARIREIEDGHWMLGSVYLAEEKNEPFLQPPLPEWVMGGLGRLMGLSGISLILTMKVLFGTLLCAGMVFFLARFSGRPWVSLLSVSVLLFAGPMTSAPWTFLQILQGTHEMSEFLRFTRLTNPQFSSSLFFGVLFFLTLWLQSSKRAWLLTAAVGAGLSFYVYPYTWTYLLAVFGLLLIQYAWLRDWERAKWILLAYVVIAIIGLPSILHMAEVASHPAYTGLSQRFGLVHTREPVRGLWLTALLIVSAIPGWMPKATRPLLWALAGAGILALNQQILTGVAIVPHHYHWYYIHPLAFLVCFLAVVGWIDVRTKMPVAIRSLTLTLLVVASVIAGILFQRQSYDAVRGVWGGYQEYAGVLTFLSANTTTNDTVYANEELRELIPIYTPADVYHAGNASVGCLCSTEHLRDTYLFDLWLQGIDAVEARRTFPTTRRAAISGRLYGIYYREAEGFYEAIPDDVISSTIDAYQTFLRLTTEQKLALHPLHVVVFSKDIPLTPQEASLVRSAQEIYADDAVRAFRL